MRAAHTLEHTHGLELPALCRTLHLGIRAPGREGEGLTLDRPVVSVKVKSRVDPRPPSAQFRQVILKYSLVTRAGGEEGGRQVVVEILHQQL